MVGEVCRGLPEDERQQAFIIGGNYGHAGALENWGETFDLPPVFSVHDNYWVWGPPPADENSVFVVVDGTPDELRELFGEVEVAANATSLWAQESRITVTVCRGLRRPLDEIWQVHRSFI